MDELREGGPADDSDVLVLVPAAELHLVGYPLTKQLRLAPVVTPRQIRAAPTVLHGFGLVSESADVAQVHLGKERLVERGPLSLSMSSKQAGSALTAKVHGLLLHQTCTTIYVLLQVTDARLSSLE